MPSNFDNELQKKLVIAPSVVRCCDTTTTYVVNGGDTGIYFVE